MISQDKLNNIAEMGYPCLMPLKVPKFLPKELLTLTGKVPASYTFFHPITPSGSEITTLEKEIPIYFFICFFEMNLQNYSLFFYFSTHVNFHVMTTLHP
jgi:hypothetical protein